MKLNAAPKLFETLIGSCGIEINKYTLPLRNLPEELVNATLVQLSDLHRGCGKTDETLSAAFEAANNLKPDILALTGDFIDEKIVDLPHIVNLISTLRPNIGIVGVLGNHDQRDDPKTVVRELERAGVDMLQNRSFEIVPGCFVAGVDDMLEGQADFELAMRDVPPDAPTIFLSHNPNGLKKIPKNAGITVLSGHTHGGQIVLPFPTPYMVCKFHLRTSYVHGWYEKETSRLYVNRGIGVTGWGKIGFRVNCPPEITLFQLEKSDD